MSEAVQAAAPGAVVARPLRRAPWSLTALLRPSPLLLLRRELWGTSRRWLTYAVRALAGGVGLAGAVIVFHRAGGRAETARDAGLLFVMVGALQLVLCLAIPPLRGLAVVLQERRRGTWDLLALARIGAERSIIGKVAGVVAFHLSLVLALAPVQLVAATFGGVGAEDMALLVLACVDLTLLGACLGAACALAVPRDLGAWGLLVLVTSLLYGVLPGLAARLFGALGATGSSVKLALAAWSPLTVFDVLERGWSATGVAAAVLVGLPLQGAAALGVAVLLARRAHLRGVDGGGDLALMRGLRRRAGPLVPLLISFGVPLVTFLSMELSGSSKVLDRLAAGDDRVWSTWLGYEAALLHLAAPLLVAAPLARERELGTMGLLLSTPRHASAVFLKPVKGLLLFLAAGTALYQLHHAVAVRFCDGLPEAMATAGIEIALASLWPASLALLLSTVAPTVWASAALAMLVIGVVELGPVVAATAAVFLFGRHESGMDLLLLSPMTVMGGEGTQWAHASLLFAAAGVAVVLLGAMAFERIQQRFQVAR